MNSPLVNGKIYLVDRGVARGGAEGALAPPEFGRSVNPIQTRGADYTPHTTASPSGFKKLSTPLMFVSEPILVNHNLVN